MSRFDPRAPRADGPPDDRKDRPMDPAPTTTSPGASASAFAEELRVRVAEAQTALDAAELLDEPLTAQIAAADLADLEALAVRNDVELEG